MFIGYIVNLLGGMFFGWIFLFTGLNSLGPKLPHRTYTTLELAAIRDELTSRGKPRPYQVVVKNNNHTHFVFKKDIPGDLAGKDERPQQVGDEADAQKMRDLFHKLAILNQLSAPGDPGAKIDLIRRERLAIYGDTEIRAPRVAIGLEDAWDDD